MSKHILILLACFALATSNASAQVLQDLKVPVKPCAAAGMTSPLFLKIDGVKGGSTDQCHRDEIEPVSFQLVGNSSMIVTKRLDISSGAMFVGAASGKHYPQAVLTVLLQSRGEQQQMTYTMKDMRITSYQQNVGAATREQIELRFAQLKTEVAKTSTRAAASPPLPGVDIFSRVPGIPGDSQDPQHLHEIVAQTMSFNLSAGSGKANIGDFIIEKGLDSSSPKLLQAAAAGTHLSEVVLTLRQRGGADFFVIKLTNVLVTGDTQQGSGSGQKETVRFRPAKIEIRVGAPNGPSQVPAMRWDVASNTKV